MTRRICFLLILITMVCVCFSGCAESEPATTLAEFAAQVEMHASRLEATYPVYCDKALMETLKQYSPVGADTTLLSEILMQSGSIGAFSVAWYDDHVEMRNMEYYAGWKILHRWQTGDTAKLNQKERQTLVNALSMVTLASGSDLEKERYIYDAICSAVTYEKRDDGTGEKDCAVGALLNGRADCDGYSDAMMLCCGLAEIPCRYIHGRAISARQQSRADDDGSHMWNLVHVGGSWVMCDDTWGDQDGETPGYLYFNIGSGDAAAAYQWNGTTLFTEIAPATDFSTQLMPDQQPAIVHTEEEVYQAACVAAAAGNHRLMLHCPAEILWQTDGETFRSMLLHGALGSFTYADNGRMYELTGIALPEDPFRFCADREEILSAIQAYADADVHSFSLYFHPALAPRLFADGHAELQQILSESCLAEAGRYQYSEDSGSVHLTDVSFTSSQVPVCHSTEEVLALIRRELPAQPSSLMFCLGDGLAFESVQEAVTNAVYSLGVNAFGYLLSGNRVTLTDLAYYDNYCTAESYDEALAYARGVRNDGMSELRIYCSEELYDFFRADQASAFFGLLKEAGFTAYTVYYSDEYRVLSAEELR